MSSKWIKTCVSNNFSGPKYLFHGLVGYYKYVPNRLSIEDRIE